MVKVLPRRPRHPFLERFESNLETICLLLVSFWQEVFMVFCYCSFRDVDVDSLFLLCFRMLHCCSFLFRSLFLLVYFTIAFHIFKVCPLFSFRATPAQNNVYFHYPLCHRLDNNLYNAFITEFELRSMIP